MEVLQTRPATEATIRGWYRNGRTGNGLVTGYGNPECLEFDDRATYEAFKATAAALGIGGLVERIEAGYCEETPGGGVHWLYRCETIQGNTKLAERPDPNDPHERKPLIETRGTGGFVITAPSRGKVHPSGKPDRLLCRGLETTSRDCKEGVGAGRQQVRFVWANIGAFHICLWTFTMTEAWVWGRPEEELVDRSDSPWDAPNRRPSHAAKAKRRAWRREPLAKEIHAALHLGLYFPQFSSPSCRQAE